MEQEQATGRLAVVAVQPQGDIGIQVVFDNRNRFEGKICLEEKMYTNWWLKMKEVINGEVNAFSKVFAYRCNMKSLF